MILFCRFDIYFELKYRENYPNSELQDLSADYAAELVITDDVLPAEQSRPAAPHGGGGALHHQRPGGVEGGGPGDRETGAVDYEDQEGLIHLQFFGDKGAFQLC